MSTDFTFILGNRVIGNLFVMTGVQALAGKEMEPEGFVFRKMDPQKRLLVAVEGVDGRKDYLPLCFFSQHPPEEEIRRSNNLKAII